MIMSFPRRLAPAALLAGATLALASCGSSNSGLIPSEDASPLQSDFEAVARAALSGGGSCAATAQAIRTTERDFEALPSSVAPSLRARLSEGIANLRTRALLQCAKPLSSATSTTTSSSSSTPTTSSSTSTSTTSRTTSRTTTSSPTETSTTTSTSTTPTTSSTTSAPGGGTQAPEVEKEGAATRSERSEHGEHAQSNANGNGGAGQGGEP